MQAERIIECKVDCMGPRPSEDREMHGKALRRVVPSCGGPELDGAGPSAFHSERDQVSAAPNRELPDVHLLRTPEHHDLAAFVEQVLRKRRSHWVTLTVTQVLQEPR